ncbi:DUF4260 domain-containing protein [Gracilimonas sediminicola]|uniref:DUF4260 domain-containing protein n=1 Tax=Gracilimonas sediminicola TaxID=2952158 RepID=A0A9X2L3X1_9BACT|nr:DUF4260 domain-containing protein [Gracilimonas sediminicola]MCP9291802.1 DUF4260 domain-containing protein [Gracilimonas sediminicola]
MNIELSKHLKLLLNLEELALFIGSVILFGFVTSYSWWTFALLFFLPDISFAAYLINTNIGSWIYNFFHHKGLMIVLVLAGYFAEIGWLIAIGIVFLSHAAFDRIFGYGLKFPDDFKHTHLGRIGG